MHPRAVFILLLTLTGFSLAQSTNFPTGPQYLITTDSPLFLRPISTPSVTVGELQAGTSVTATEADLAQEAPMPSSIASERFLSNIYWGDHSAAEAQARRITTPSLSPSQVEMNSAATSNEVEAPATQEGLPGMLPQAPEPPSEIEISSGSVPINLPLSIFDPGVTGIADKQFFRERGYGMPLGEVAKYWNARKVSVIRVFTNRDVERLHGQ